MRNAIFPALGYGPLGPRLRKCLVREDWIAPYLRSLYDPSRGPMAADTRKGRLRLIIALSNRSVSRLRGAA